MMDKDMREQVVNNIICTMSPVMETMHLQMLEGAVRGALHGMQLVKECTELSTEMDDTRYILECFAANKKLEGCTELTLDQYLRTARRFFLQAGKGYKYITKDDVKYYLALRSQQVRPNTLNNEKRNLSSLFTWLHDEGMIEKNPVKPVKGIRGEDVEIKYFSIEEEIAIRDVPCSLRDRAVIAFLFSTGVRVGELSQMDRIHVDMIKGAVVFRGEKSRKGKFRTVYLDTRARKYLAEYLAGRKDAHPALFVTERLYNGQPKRIHKAGYEAITHRVCEQAGIRREKGTVHVFRRTFATRLADRNCPIEVIQELMGHSDSGTTSRHYIDKSSRRTQVVWEQYVLSA